MACLLGSDVTIKEDTSLRKLNDRGTLKIGEHELHALSSTTKWL